ncbi:MAG: class I SAM-dependent methyltransferase [bacterium]
MYNKSAKFYDALYHFIDYKTSSDRLREIINAYNPDAKTLLDTACGTGKHIGHLKEHFKTEGLDINGELLEIARIRNPGSIFHEFDMTDFELNKKYDVITCLFSSIAYVKTPENLYKAVSSMEKHLSKGGLLIIEPWFSKENFWINSVTANHYDEKDFKITWMYTSKLMDSLSILDIHYLVGTPEEVSHFTEKHEIGLFDESEYRGAMERTGLKVVYDEKGLFGRGMFIGIKN